MLIFMHDMHANQQKMQTFGKNGLKKFEMFYSYFIIIKECLWLDFKMQCKRTCVNLHTAKMYFSLDLVYYFFFNKYFKINIHYSKNEN